MKTAPFKLDGVYCRLIKLTKGQYAIVWEADFALVSTSKWHARWNRYTRSFYAARNARKDNGKRYTLFMHRVLLGLEVSDKRRGDHIESGQTLDNRRSNLRIATHQQNCQNARTRVDNLSGLKGVSFQKKDGKWKARIRVNGRYTHLGWFDTKEEAYAAYCTAAGHYFGEFARVA